ncbi:hypothetical protein WA026_001251 [Henosepilachna vigintioctopunctata]|uniref:Cell division cycle protein 27 homolog n=1 Tax=Henosepilachna vigintioctopunctata TaxID=420089 RepID=A0AAW1UJZ6_9CUCU
MIIQEPVQASIWHCLNNYNYKDAIFLAERLYAEVDTSETLFLLATCYYRSGQKNQAYFTLKSKPNITSQCKYLLGICAYDLGKYAEAEASIKDNFKVSNTDGLIHEYGDQASFVLLLLGKIAAKTERKIIAIEYWKAALKLNPFLWSSFEELCKIGDKPNAQTAFQINNLENLSMCHGYNLNNIETAIIPENIADTQEGTPKEFLGYVIKTPQQLLARFNLYNQISTSVCTPDESPLANPLGLSGFAPIPTTKHKPFRLKMELASPMSPSFGFLVDSSPEFNNSPKLSSQQTLTESNNYNLSFPKRLKSQDNLVRKESILQNTKNQCITVSMTKTPTLQTCLNVRRSSRLFSNSYSVKENNTSPNRNKFVTPKSPTKKTKQRVPKFNLNKNNFHENNTRNMNKVEKEKSETITSEMKTETEKTENNAQKGTLIQKQSAEGLMILLRTMGQALVELSTFHCKQAVETLSTLSKNQYNTSWVQCHLGMAYFELAEYEKSIKYFNEVHIRQPHLLDYMDIYSTCLWHLQKEVQLSALAQDLTRLNEHSPVTWCVSGNCMSLHKEHDSAIKFFQRAVQVDPNFTYAYTLLGHEYITTEELDKAMSCFRNAIRLDPRHYNAWFGIGTIYSKQERFHLAEMNFSRALTINPSSIILCHIGIVQHALKQSLKALNTLDLAVQNNPRSPLCKFHRGSIYFALGRHSEALKELEELKQIVPKESLVYYLIGKVHKKLGNTDLALMYFSWATDLDPKGASNQIRAAFDPPVRNRMGPENDYSPNSPVYQSESPFGLQAERNNYINLHEDSDDSF